MEQWRSIAGYDGLYEVSSLGRVKSLARRDSLGRPVAEKILRCDPSGTGYPLVDLYRSGARRMTQVHRLVAQAFLLNPDGLPQVNHIDGSRNNNAVSNLEWIRARDNVVHGMHELNRERGPCARRKVEAIQNGRVVMALPSTRAALALGHDPSAISKCCRGALNTHHGLSWRYAV